MIFKKVLALLNKREKFQVNFLIISFLVAYCFEVISFGLMIPLFSKVIYNNNSLMFFEWNIEVYLNFLNINNNIIFLSCFVFFIFLVKNFILLFLRFFQNRIVFNIRFRISSFLYKLYLNSDYNFHLNNNSSILIRNINASRSVGLYVLYLTEIIADVLLIAVLIFCSLFLFTSKIILLVLTYFFFLAGYYFFFRNRLKNWSFSEQENESKYLKLLQEGFKSIKEIIVSNKNDIFVSNFNKLSFVLRNYGYKLSWLPQASKYFTETFVVLFLLILIYFLPNQNFSNNNNFQTLLMLAFILYRLFPAMQKILTSFQRLNVASGPMKIVITEFDNVNLLKNNRTIKNYLTFNSSISLKDIGFSYNNHTKILNNINLEILKNDFIAITGSSGSGKTTLVDLLSGLLKPSSGSIVVDGVSISHAESLKIGYVSQFVSLLDDTIIKNVAFAENESSVDLKKIDKILDMVNLKEFVYSLPNNIHTVIGENGSKISGGQRQRLGIARALYNNIQLLILDEPTSMLDEINEKFFFENLRTLKNSITVVLISHNKKNLFYFDHLYKLENGYLSKIN